MSYTPAPRVHRIITCTLVQGPYNGQQRKVPAGPDLDPPSILQVAPEAAKKFSMRGVYRRRPGLSTFIWVDVPPGKPLPAGTLLT